jgi:hypothetical protein
MRRLAILLLLAAPVHADPLNGDWYIELGAGYNTSFMNDLRPWDNAGSPGFMGALSYEWRLDNGMVVGAYYAHYSQWFSGPPFNDDAESSLDSMGVKIRWRLN